MKTLTYWMKDPSLGNNVIGPGHDTWGRLSELEIEPSLSKQFFNLLKTLILPTRQKCDLDLVVTDPQRKVDRLTNWVATAYIPFYFALVRRFQRGRYSLPQSDEEAQRENQARSKDKKAPFDRSAFQKQTIETLPVLVFASSLSMLVICLLPTIAIVVLAQLQHLRDLLICLASFTAGFALIIPYLTRDEPTKMEVFLASAA